MHALDASWTDIRSALIDGSVHQLPVENIIKLLQLADQDYFNINDEASTGPSPLSDAEYDALKQLAQRMAPSDEYFTGVGSKVRGAAVKLPYQMGSLDQIYAGDYDVWVARHRINTAMVAVSDKLDGNSAMLVYNAKGKLQIAFSRGDGVEGADNTRHMTLIPNVPSKVKLPADWEGNLVVRAEVIIPIATFEKIRGVVMSRSGKPYKNPRNMVAGVMNASTNNPIVYQHIHVVAYEIIGSDLGKEEQFALLGKLGFETARHTMHSADMLSEDLLTRMLTLNRRTSAYEIDGLVIDVDAADLRKEINPTKDTLNPAYAVKFKVADASNRATPKVTGVTWAISKDGYLKPTIQIEPTDLVGVTIQNCTGFNAKFIKENGIGPGARIVLVRSGDVIPFCQSVVSPAPGGAQMPTEQNVVWTSTGVDLVLTNASEDETVRFEQLLDFFNTLDIANLGEGNLRPIFDAGFEWPEDVITLTQEDLSALVGSTAIGKKIFAAMRARLVNIPEYQLMGAYPAFGRGVGVRKMKKLWEHFNGDISHLDDTDRVSAVEGFDTKTATKVAKGMEDYIEFKAAISKYVTFKPYEAPVGGNLTGKTFVFTGFRSKDLEKAVEAAGGKMGSAVSSKTSYVVADDVNSSSGKAATARSLGVAVISMAQLKELLA
jgi:NAD-dependent DNA ligase